MHNDVPEDLICDCVRDGGDDERGRGKMWVSFRDENQPAW